MDNLSRILDVIIVLEIVSPPIYLKGLLFHL